jgi:hypothetical protein
MTFTASGAVAGTVTLTPNEGTIIQAGTPITSANLNNLENGVSGIDTRLTTVEGKYFDKSAGGNITGDVGLGITPVYGFHQLGGSQKLQALANPTQPSVTTVGATGATSYSYYIVANDGNGGKTLVSPVRTITTGNATLSGTNYNTISWTAVSGASSYDVLKADTGHSIALGVTGTSFNDTGIASSAYTVPTVNTTANSNIDGSLTTGADVVVGGHLHVGGAGHDIIFDAGRTNTSNIYWNANAGTQFGMGFTVDGNNVLNMNIANSAGTLASMATSGDIDIRSADSGGWTYISSNVGVIALRSGQFIKCTNMAGSAFIPINASAFTVNSDRDMKKNIIPFTENAESLVNTTTVYNYNYNNELDSEMKHTGLIMQEAPVYVVDPRGDGIDIYAMCGVLWKAVQELSAKVQALTPPPAS